MKIALTQLQMGPDVERLVLEVLRSGQLAQGPMVERLEQGFRDLAGTRHALAVSSGTTALVVALQALELESGAEVITSPFTFVATLNAILEAGCTARFVDVGADFTMDESALAEVLTDRTSAILPVHLFGLPAAMDSISAFAAEHDLALVEDAAQAHGARCGVRAVGSYGVGCFSLYATKNVTTGEGGIVTTESDELADRIRLLRNQGMRERYRYELPGHNYRLTDLQAAVGIPQLERLPEQITARQRNAAGLSDRLSGIEGLVPPDVPMGREHVWHQYTVRITPQARSSREVVASSLAKSGIASGVYYPRPVFDYECYRSHPAVVVAEVPNAYVAAREVLSLPVHQGLQEQDLDAIADAVRQVLA